MRFARWRGPKGFTSAFHTFEFRDGGSWLFTMHGPDGQDHADHGPFDLIVMLEALHDMARAADVLRLLD